MSAQVLSLKQLINLCICAFGIQFVTALQAANMSSIYKFLGAESSNLPYLWLAAPISGLLIQPLVGQISDSTTTRFGKRRPYILMWGLLAGTAIFLMPFSYAIWMAAFLLWILDSSINGCTETLRALTADITTNKQKPKAFAFQAFFAGIGASVAAILPFIFSHYLLAKQVYEDYSIPIAIKISFVIGSSVLISTIIWTVLKIKEPPFRKTHLLQEKKKQRHKSVSYKFFEFFKEMLFNIYHMPEVIRKFYLIQMFTWIGMYCLWIYFGLAIAQQIYHLPVGANTGTNSYYADLLEKGTEWAGICFGIYQLVSVFYSLALPYLAEKTSPRFIHGCSMVIGALGILSLGIVTKPIYSIFSMVAIGILWGSIMTMPYAIISAELPKGKTGVYLGIFNITITIPQIISSLIFGEVANCLFHNYAVYPLMTGGALILVGGILMLRQANSEKKLSTQRRLLPLFR